jgi:hypothetical protein
MGGALAPLGNWRLLAREWRDAAMVASVEEFHSRDFSPGGRYFEWDETRKHALFGALMNIMNRHVEIYIGAAVHSMSFDMMTIEQKHALIDPYYVCLQSVVHGVALQARFMHEGRPVNVVFADHPEFTGRAWGLWSAMKQHPDIGPYLGEMTVSTPTLRTELQAADWIAFELAQHADKRVTRPDLPIRWPIRQMASKAALFKVFNHERLMRGFFDAEETLGA